MIIVLSRNCHQSLAAIRSLNGEAMSCHSCAVIGHPVEELKIAITASTRNFPRFYAPFTKDSMSKRPSVYLSGLQAKIPQTVKEAALSTHEVLVHFT